MEIASRFTEMPKNPGDFIKCYYQKSPNIMPGLNAKRSEINC